MPVSLSARMVNGEFVRQGLEDLDKAIPLVSRKRIYLMMLRARTKLRQPAPKPKYPIRWDSPVQKRAYFASDGFGAGIPYHRTNELPRGWNIVSSGNGYMLENNGSAAVHVFGDFSGARQSSIHEGRWQVAQEVLADEVEKLPPEIEEAISSEGRKILG